jgi:hypothetical protein
MLTSFLFGAPSIQRHSPAGRSSCASWVWWRAISRTPRGQNRSSGGAAVTSDAPVALLW